MQTDENDAQIQRVLSEMVQLNSDNVFFLWMRDIKLLLKAGHYRPASEMPFKWRFTGGPMMAQH